MEDWLAAVSNESNQISESSQSNVIDHDKMIVMTLMIKECDLTLI